MNITNLFHLDYWFTQPFAAHGSTLWILVGGFLLLIIVGLILRILVQSSQDKINKIILRRFSVFSMLMGLWGMAWMFFRQEKIPFLAWRFWLLLWLLVTVYWLSRILEYVVKRVPVIRQERQARERKEKYLPTSS